MNPHETLFYAFLVLLSFLLVPAADAYELYEHWSCSSHRRWYEGSGDLTFHIYEKSFPGPFTREAVIEPARRINYVGGQWLDIESWKLIQDTVFATLTTINGRNEVWKSNLTNGMYSMTVRRGYHCWMITSDVIFDDHPTYSHGVPGDYGDRYWMLMRGYTTDRLYLRPLILHEFLHAVGLEHEDGSYAFMNQSQLHSSKQSNEVLADNVWPWANRDGHQHIEPLPDDRRGLRRIYGNGGSENDTAVLGTYYDTSVPWDEDERQKLYCRPSLGSGWAEGLSLEYCGENGTRYVCPGDQLRVRFVQVNYGTSDATVQQKLYFSTDTVLSDSDVPSATSYETTVSKHRNEARKFTVPNLAPGVYWPIFWSQRNGEESAQNNRTVATGTIRVRSDC